jgi:hypothetical protein
MKLTNQNTRVDYTESYLANITILEGDDSGIVYQYGRVWVNTDDVDNPSLQFDYNVIQGTPVDKKSFEHDVATLLHTMIVEQLEAGEVQYTGGTDPDKGQINSLIQEASTGLEFPTLNTQVGAFVAKPKENAMDFLNRLAAEGSKAMK